MDKDPHDGSGPPPEQEAKDRILSCGIKPNILNEDLATGNPGDISRPNESSDGPSGTSFETRSRGINEDSEAAESLETSRINSNEGSDGVATASSQASSNSTNEGDEGQPATSREFNSISPNEIIIPNAETSKPNESTEQLAAASPGSSRSNEGSEELAAVNSSNISIMANKSSDELTAACSYTSSSRSNESTKELAVESPRSNNEDPGSENKDPKSAFELQPTVPTSESGKSSPSKFYRPPSMRARQQKQNEAGLVITNASVPTVPTFEQFILQQVKEKKRQEPFAKESNYPNTSSLISRANQSLNRNEQPQRKRRQNTYVRDMSCNILAEISRSESVIILEKINRQKESFKKLIDSPPDDRNRDVFALVFELVTNVWKSSFEESKKLLLLEICNSKFIDNLQLYLMQLPYTESRSDKLFNKHYWTKEKEFWNKFMTFCECLINVSPSTAVRKCGALIEATSKSCLDGLKEKHDFELPEEYTTRMTNVRDRLKKQAQIQKIKDTSAKNEPLESFRELSVLPTGSELLERRPFLRPNVVEGAYADVEHYLDVQFRLLREDCFGPLREGIHQYIEEPKKRKYDHIRVYRNVKFLGPFFTKQQFGSLVLLDQYTEKMFKKMNWKQSKRFLFGSLLLFTKDNCKNFLVGTILQRDAELLSKRILGVSIIDSTMDSDLYNEDLYTMIECEVYFEPYHHVLKALQDPNFPEHLAMSKYIVDVQKVPENPTYLTRDTVYTLNKKRRTVTKLHLFGRRKDEDEWLPLRSLRSGEKEEKELKFTVLQDETWPSETELGLNNTQYEAYKLALTHEFAVIQGPPGTGKTFLGVKVAKTLLENAPYSDDECLMLVICYTNHALDQFLEALLPITDSIVRIGGRSQSQLLEKHNISNFRGWACYEERAQLEYRIRKLKDFYEACISPDILLNYITVVKYAEECEIVHRFYKGKYEDALKHWLFGNVENVEIIPRLEEHVQSDGNEKLHENNHVDNDIYARDELGIDDDDIDEVYYRRLYGSSLVSFSLPEAEEEMNMLVKKYHEILQVQVNLEEQNQEVGMNYGDIVNTLQDLQHEIFQLDSQINIFKDMMICQSRAPRINLAHVRDLSTVPLIERWSYYYKWAAIAKGYLKKQAKKREELVQSAAQAYEEARMIADRSLLRGTRVIGMTTSAAARLRKLLVEVSPPIVIVEEAAEVLEAHIVTSLTKQCKHLILIGDHQQLRPSAAYMRLARHYQLEVSLFERMIRNGVHSRRLGVQHRMRPEIAALVSPHIYPDLQNHRSVEDFPPVRGVAHNLFFFSHNYMEQHEDENSTRTNTLEADFTLRLANYLMQQGYKPDDVTIVAAYSGQMFYMRRQRSLYDHLSDVKITVLDNYQGEESKIILLSLVRNNDHDSIGFLGTENRICVALSRAREGFFILGNMELLKRNSTLWTNIAQTLADNGSLGSNLKLKCENHGQITEITSLEDFVKVPEGGCLLDCKYNLACGHPCPRMCHAYDIAHASIQCTRDCEREICEIEGHKCPSSCSTKCQPCRRYMDKQLPCGHTRAVPCYMAPDDPAVYCAEEVTVSLPGCGHKATKPCSKRISDVYCVENCEAGRLSCGHACIRRCHVNDDPDHENYKCEKPCPRAKKGCTANLEGDLGDHQCPLSCGEPCLPCDVQVNKKKSGCKHWKRGACSEDLNAEHCREKCARSLPCAHHCKKLCFEKCGDCKQKVKKRIPDCNHEIEIECESEATREHCKKKCERIMNCGHPCRADCRKPCDPTTCKEITEHSSEAPCGHIVQLPCYVYQAKQSGSVLEVKLLSACTAPCGALLRCGHACGGSCSGCRQGRLHRPCAARCHQLNICGHRYVCVHSAVWRAAPLRARMRRLVLRLPPGPPAPALRRALPPAQHLRTQV
ncbi:NFX1-type zinc finger-containing protein 1-like isoform X1 [Cydia pomonella]|uniref:NFX1-type zinc finger-containing protein 1-like isoform X1 n=1 Tax=Cydia pomonella TaxID=82600 RepID=UPI002ADE55DD|nr:NFX1-type zinc finger-containing protein 1-like isoform X1 [Cydia pomonella]XP_061715964.1 NFX1-type zinc finger-containing protein 1-like isoform X1 [Cydia pomonella]